MAASHKASPHLLLAEQLCFPLYAASRLFTRLYQPLLEPLGITYPQYIVLLVLWQYGKLSVSEIGEKTFLESNTLTPLLKKMEAKGLVVRAREQEDERVVRVSLTASGIKLEKRARLVPEELYGRLQVPGDELRMLRTLLNRFVGQLNTALQDEEA